MCAPPPIVYAHKTCVHIAIGCRAVVCIMRAPASTTPSHDECCRSGKKWTTTSRRSERPEEVKAPLNAQRKGHQTYWKNHGSRCSIAARSVVPGKGKRDCVCLCHHTLVATLASDKKQQLSQTLCQRAAEPNATDRRMALNTAMHLGDDHRLASPSNPARERGQ